MLVQDKLQHADAPLDHQLLVKLTLEKEVAEQALAAVLQQAQTSMDHKMWLTQGRRQQKESLLSGLQSARQQITSLPFCRGGYGALSVAEVKLYNDTQLDASYTLFTALAKTQQAQAYLQQCLEAENALLTSLGQPLHQGMLQSAQVVQHTIDALQREDPQRELQHVDTMLRYCAYRPCSALTDP